TAQLADNSVTSAKLSDFSVTPNKLEPSTINGQVLTTVINPTDTLIAWANSFHATGKIIENIPTSNAININSVNRIGIGNYQIFFTTPASSTNYIIQLTLLSSDVHTSIRVIDQNTTDFTIQISRTYIVVPNPDDPDPTPITLASTGEDATWFFTVIDL
ncbi:MAG TPA: hypothetical protein VLZ54_02645, partial [Arenibacter sp.]|nr:hypothetical protein [Arenibacter sp.]